MELSRLLWDRFDTVDLDPSPTEASETIEMMLRHRSCRDFADAPVNDELVQLVFAAALSSPSKSDLQQVTIIWLTDPDRRRRITELSPANVWAMDAPQLAVFCADGRRIRRAAERLGRRFPNNHLDQFMNAAVDCGIALGAAIHAASSVGLGCCPISELRDRATELIEILELPEYVVPVAGLALGWPSDPDRPVTPRLPLEVRLQRNSYTDKSFDSSAATYERLRSKLDPRPPQEQRHVDEFGATNPYGWSEDRTRQYSRPLRADWGAVVRRQGFGLG